MKTKIQRKKTQKQQEEEMYMVSVIAQALQYGRKFGMWGFNLFMFALFVSGLFLLYFGGATFKINSLGNFSIVAMAVVIGLAGIYLTMIHKDYDWILAKMIKIEAILALFSVFMVYISAININDLTQTNLLVLLPFASVFLFLWIASYAGGFLIALLIQDKTTLKWYYQRLLPSVIQ